MWNDPVAWVDRTPGRPGLRARPARWPLRLSIVVHAPVDAVTDVLADHDDLRRLLDDDWLSLTVLDPEQDHRAFHYEHQLEWARATPRPVSPTRGPHPRSRTTDPRTAPRPRDDPSDAEPSRSRPAGSGSDPSCPTANR